MPLSPAHRKEIEHRLKTIEQQLSKLPEDDGQEVLSKESVLRYLLKQEQRLRQRQLKTGKI